MANGEAQMNSPIRRSPIRKVRSKPRPGRLKGDDMDELRQAVYTRDLGLCQRCGITTIFGAPEEWDNSFHLAHRKGKRMWGDSLETTEINCGKCHRRFHNFGPSMEKPCPPKPKSIDTD
jgi:5-methylcytosine-specific restriction endonuclease McrA